MGPHEKRESGYNSEKCRKNFNRHQKLKKMFKSLNAEKMPTSKKL